MLIDTLKARNIEAMRNKEVDARGVITIVMSRYKNLEVEKKAANEVIGDTDLLVIMQKLLKELHDEKEDYINVNNTSKVNSITIQEEEIKKYLPKNLSEEEIRKEIASLLDKSMPSIMKHFKTNFAGRVDMSLVSKIARE